MQAPNGRSFPSFPLEAEQLMQQAAAALQSQDRAQIEPAETKVKRALELAGTGSVAPHENAEAWVTLGHIQEIQNTPEKVTEAAASYGKAAELLRPNATAGIQERGRTVVALMNQGNALQKLGAEEPTRAAIQAYDEALTLAQGLPQDKDARLIGALLMNRGAAIQRFQGADPQRAAVETFRAAVATLDRAAAQDGHARALALAARVNLADAVARSAAKPDLTQAITICSEVVNTVSAAEEQQPEAADLGFRARRVICQAAGTLLQDVAPGGDEQKEFLATATDRAEEALKLAQHWEGRGAPVFRPWARWFFEFATAMYSQHQPQFLAEFLTETLFGEKTPQAWTEAQELRRIALTNTGRVRTAFREQLFSKVGGPEAEALTEVLTELQALEGRLSAGLKAE